jgi:S-adenosylmethionine-diacylglycerol 3-amino-3-carboxypropyl transferase
MKTGMSNAKRLESIPVIELLMTPCAEVISIDMNRIQNHLLSLKLAAIAALDYEKYLAFLGCTPSKHRVAMLNDIKPFLSAETLAFWQTNQAALRKGIIYQGRMERLTKASSLMFRLVRPSKIRKLFSFDHLDEQRQFVKQEWDTPMLRKLFSVVVNPKLLRHVLNDPGLNSYVDYAEKPGLYIYQRMIDLLDNRLAKNSALLNLLFRGSLSPEAYFPYLTHQGYRAIRQSQARIAIVTGNTIDFLNQPTSAGQIDCFSMSDIASYMPQEAFEKLLRGIQHAAKPNARFCLREFISNRKIPNELQPVYKRDNSLESKLEKEESNFVYRFMVGEIQK